MGWDGDTKTVSLSYPDVTISLTIGSASATVNSHTEQLSAAPELYYFAVRDESIIRYMRGGLEKSVNMW